MTTASLRIQAIRRAQANIRQRIAEIQNQLDQLHQIGIPSSQPWISFHQVWTARQLSGPHVSIFEALRDDLEVLKRELAALTSEIGREQKRAARVNAVEASSAFKQKLEKILRDGEKANDVDMGAIESLRVEQEKALDGWINALKADPSHENIKETLYLLRDAMMVGLGDSPKAQAAMGAVVDSAEKAKDAAEARYRREPSYKNFREYMKNAFQSEMFGGKGMDAAPRGLLRVRAERTHQVIPGDSLSSISRQFYGSEGYWDLIFLNNLGLIGTNPEKLPVGVILDIP